ncbi:hydrolase [Streptomyces seoulensis]|nr:hydrolase [Streptomyces seoulensis]
MRSPHPPPPPRPPRPAAAPAESDHRLVARLRESGGGPDGGHHAVALLLARHWRATYDYAVVCLAAPGGSAAMVATAAFRRVLRGPANGTSGGAAGGTRDGAAGRALRPRLLVAVRETVRQWAADDAACAVLPELRRPSGGRGLRAVPSLTPERRRLAERAFHDLPGAFQCLLWHTEAEADPLTVPAGLLAMDPKTAAGLRERAREQFRAGCLRAHRELAPTGECLILGPLLLDVPTSRGGALPPGARRHLRECRHCAHAAEQFGCFDGGLDVLLAEAVLGWGARRYLDSRTARGVSGGGGRADGGRSASGASGSGGAGSDGSGGAAGSGGRGRAAEQWRGHRTAVAVGAGLASLVLLTGVPTAGPGGDDRSAPAARTAWSLPGGGPAARRGTAGTVSPVRSGPAGPAPAAGVRPVAGSR